MQVGWGTGGSGETGERRPQARGIDQRQRHDHQREREGRAGSPGDHFPTIRNVSRHHVEVQEVHLLQPLLFRWISYQFGKNLICGLTYKKKLYIRICSCQRKRKKKRHAFAPFNFKYCIELIEIRISSLEKLNPMDSFLG